MPDDEPTPAAETPPGPQPDQDTYPDDDKDDDKDDTKKTSDDGPDVNEKSADSFPASDPPSW
jgi:hypothetical protein